MAVQHPASAPAPMSAPAEHSSVTEIGSYNFRATAVVGLIVGIIDVIITARFLGKLFGASVNSSFVHGIYSVSAPLIAPFTGIFGDTGAKTNTFETASL